MSNIKWPIKLQEVKSFDGLSEELFEDIVDGNGERLFCSISSDPSRMLKFMTDTNEHQVSECADWCLDLSFKVIMGTNIEWPTFLGSADAKDFQTTYGNNGNGRKQICSIWVHSYVEKKRRGL